MIAKSNSRGLSALAVGLGVLAIAAMIAGIFAVSTLQRPNAQVDRVTIAQAGDFFLYAPLYIAKDVGFFNQNNLNVRIVTTGGDDKTWAAVLSGDAQFGIADPTFIAISAQQGKTGRVIAGLVNGVPFWGVTEDPGIAPFDDASDLNGYTVGTFPEPSTAWALQARMFENAGLDPEIRQGAFGALLPMLRSGNADIVLELEPNISTAVEEGAHVVYSLADLYGDFAITGLTTSPQTIKAESDLVGRVVCALQMALDYLRKNPSESISVLSERFPEIPQSVARSALERVLGADIIPPTAIINEEAWEKAVDLRIDLGQIPPGRGAYEEFVDPAFARAAAENCRADDSGSPN